MRDTPKPDDSTLLTRARDDYFRYNGFSERAYKGSWVRIKIGPLPVWLPNFPARQRAVVLHDLHHIATGYDTTFLGETEIAAWELGSGCRNYVGAWVLNIGGVAGGILLAPRRTWRAFLRGRRSTNLYQLGFNEEWLKGTVGQLRRRLGLLA